MKISQTWDLCIVSISFLLDYRITRLPDPGDYNPSARSHRGASAGQTSIESERMRNQKHTSSLFWINIDSYDTIVMLDCHVTVIMIDCHVTIIMIDCHVTVIIDCCY